MDLPEHKWAVVTGASDGIGQEIARVLASRGTNLILVARRANRLQKFAAELQRDFAVQCRVVDVDLGERDAVERIMLAQRHCDVSLLVAAAGFGSSGDFLDLPLDDELSMVDVNCRAIVQLTHEFGRIFADRRSGIIILLSSLFAFQGVAGAATYAATKAFIQSFAEGLKHEFGRANVNVLAVAPGPVLSGFGERANMAMRFGQTPERVAKSVVRHLKRRGTLRPGLPSKLIELSLYFLPRAARSMVLGRVMAGMTKHVAVRHG